jgi:hypothetical protein
MNPRSWHFVNSHPTNIADVSLSENKNIPAPIDVPFALDNNTIWREILFSIITTGNMSTCGRYLPPENIQLDE